MPKRHRTAPQSYQASSSRRDYHQINFLQRDKENNHDIPQSAHLVTGNDPLLTCVKIEVEEADLAVSDLKIPLKLEDLDSENSSIKEESLSDNEVSSGYPADSNRDLNIVIEWALNLQFDHSKRCSGRLYPCKEILDSVNCKIVVLYCTVCKKRMLHTLKDWAVLNGMNKLF